MSSKPIVLTLGDRFGIGPELVVRLLAEGNLPADLVVVGDRRVYDDAASRLGHHPDIPPVSDLTGTRRPGARFLDVPFEAPVGPLGRVDASAGRESLGILDWIARAISGTAIAGAVYAPLNKQAMRDAGHKNGDEFDYLVSRLGTAAGAGEVNWLDGIWTSRVTSHIPLAKVADHISAASISQAVRLLHKVMAGSGIERPRLVVAALNPHAGENGVFGTEEIEIIRPAVEALQRDGLDVAGPFPADTIFPQSLGRRPVGIVTMYHDQGQIALKMLGLGQSVTMLAGLDVPVATPGHGTAYDIVGKGIARMDSMRSAMSFCHRLRTGASVAIEGDLLQPRDQRRELL